jgi:predicted Zn-dependent protease
VKKLGKHAPPPAALETLSAAQADADKDTLASLSAAEGKAKDALEVAGPKSYFPQATAALAVIEIQWADALNDQANFVTAKGADGSDAKAADLQAQAKARLKAAFDALSPAIKANPKSPDLQIALADYYRAQHSGSMRKALKVAQALKADDAKVSQVEGMALAQDDESAERAIPKLRAALAGNPQSARLHFRLALAYQAMKDDANVSSELKETLKLSPQHERAKLFKELSTASADGK